MAAIHAPMSDDWTAADLFERFGPIPLRRIRFDPLPGSATMENVIAIHDRENRLFELVDGTLVEKVMGLPKAVLGAWIGTFLANHLDHHDLGVVAGADGMMRLTSGNVRIPDVAFIAYERFPEGRLTDEPIPDLAPDLAVEVLSPSNTKREMDRKLREYFEAGTRLAWYVDPDIRVVKVYTGPDPDRFTPLREGDVLDGGEVLPGFALPVGEVFRERRAPGQRPPEPAG